MGVSYMKFRLGTIYLMVVLLLGMFVQESYGYIPSRQAKFITFSNVNANTMTINWVRGNGQGVIVLVDDASIDVSGLGENEATATPFANMSGSDYNGTAAKLVYQGTGTQVVVTGLSPETTYHVMVLEYNVDGSEWDINNGTASLNPRSKKTLDQTLGLPSGMANDAITATTATVDWTTDGTIAAGYYIDVRLSNGAIEEAYDLLDIGLPTSKNFYITGLTGSTAYQWRLRPYDAQGRVGAATSWINLTTLQVDPLAVIDGSTSSCGAYATLVATWGTLSYTPAPALGTWSTLVKPSGASEPIISVDADDGTSTGDITVDKAGEYLFQFEISVGEYFRSTTAGYTFQAPTVGILTTTESTCGDYVALSAYSSGCATTGTWSYSGPDGSNGDFGNSTNPNTYFEITGEPPVYGDYSFTWTSTYEGLTSYDEITISFDELPTAEVDEPTDEYCGLTYTLDGNTPITGATGSWYLVSGPSEGTASFYPSATTSTASVTVNKQGEYSFYWQVSNSCSTVGATKHVTFYDNPTLADAGLDAETCGTEYILAGNIPTVGTGVWSGPYGVSFGDATAYNSSVTIPSFSESFTYHSFTWTISNGVCEDSWNDVTVTFYHPVTASVTTTAGDVCGLNLELDGNNPTYGTGSWSVWEIPPVGAPNTPIPAINPGTVSFDDPTVYNTNVYVNEEGAYSFVWTITNGTCTAAAGKMVTFYNHPTTAEAGSDADNCGLTYELTGNVASFGTGSWSQYAGIGTASFDDASAYATDVTIPSFGTNSTTYTFRWSIDNGVCDTEYDDVEITFYNEPTTASAGSDVNSCGTLNGTFAGNTPVYGNGTWSKIDGPGSAGISNENSATSSFYVDAYGTYTFRWTIGNGTCDNSTDDVVFNFYETPDATTGADVAVCGLTYTLTGNNSTVGTGTWSVPSGISLSNVNAYNAVATATTYGAYTMTWSIANGTCDVDYDELTVTFLEAPVADAGEDADGCTGVDNQYTMTASLESGETGTWSAVAGNPGTATFSNNSSETSHVTFATAGTYNFKWTVSNGVCSDDDVVTITVYNPITIPAGASISGNPTPAGGTNNVQYSIPNYNADLTYSWYFTPTDGTCSALPTINNQGQNVVYLDYELDGCDGTLSVNLTDKCNKVSTYNLLIDVQGFPVITGASLANTNQTVTVNTNIPVFNSTCTTAVAASDFQLIFTKNNGTATGATITGISGTNPYTFTISVTGTPNGCETIEIKPVANKVKSGGCEVMPSTQTTGQLHLWNKTAPAVVTNVDVSAFAKQASIAWTAPTGSKTLVVVSTTNSFVDPSNYTIYPADASYGTQTYNPGTGYTVFNGTGNSVDVVGLAPNTNYYVAIWSYTELCGTNNQFFNTNEVTTTFGTRRLATKLVFHNAPTKITSGTPFNVTVLAKDDGNNEAFPGCDETLTLTGSAGFTTTLPLTQSQVTFNNVYFNVAAGDCDHVFTVDDNDDCEYSLTAGTFTADIAPTEPGTHSRSIAFHAVGKNQMGVSWTSGNGTGRLLGVRKGASIPLSDFVDGTDYSMVTSGTTATFGQGKQLPTSTASNPSWVVRRKTTTTLDTVTVTNLESNTSYNFRVVEYNKPNCDTDWSLANFKNSGTAILNPRSISTLSKLGSFNGVEIAYFDGKSYQLKVDLNWEAISEDGISYYEIYRQDMHSEDMIKVGSTNVNVSAGAGSKYTVTDSKDLTLGESYVYRLVAVDFNGQTSDLAETYVTVNDDMSKNINLTIGSVNPNPVKDVVRFDVYTSQLSPVFIEIRDVEGKVIYTEERMVNGTSTVEYKMNVKAAGTYFITVTSGDEGALNTFIYQP